MPVIYDGTHPNPTPQESMARCAVCGRHFEARIGSARYGRLWFCPECCSDRSEPRLPDPMEARWGRGDSELMAAYARAGLGAWDIGRRLGKPASAVAVHAAREGVSLRQTPPRKGAWTVGELDILGMYRSGEYTQAQIASMLPDRTLNSVNTALHRFGLRPDRRRWRPWTTSELQVVSDYVDGSISLEQALATCGHGRESFMTKCRNVRRARGC